MKMKTCRLLPLLLSVLLLLYGCAPAAEEKTDLDKAGIKEFDFEEKAPPSLAELKIGVVYGDGNTAAGGASVSSESSELTQDSAKPADESAGLPADDIGLSNETAGLNADGAGTADGADATGGAARTRKAAALIRGTREAAEALGLADSQIIEKMDISADGCAAALAELAEAGCQIIFSTDEAFEGALTETAAAFPDVEFCQLGGEMAALDSLDNTHNYNIRLSEGWFGAGTLAAYMSQSLRIGFISYGESPEEIVQFTAWYLAAMTRNGNITMDVVYTGSDSAEDVRAAAQYLAGLGCDVIGSTLEGNAAETACADLGVWFVGRDILRAGEAGEASAEEESTGEDYSDGSGYGDGYSDGSSYGNGTGDGYSDGSGYGDGTGDGYSDGSGYGDGTGDGYSDGSSYGNGSGYSDGEGEMVSHDRLLVSVHSDWAACLVKAVRLLTEGEPIPADISAGLSDGAVSLGTIAPDAASEEAVSLTEASLDSIRTRARMIFAIDGFTVNGERITSWIGPDGCDYVYGGYFHDQDPDFGGSLPVFSLLADGISTHGPETAGTDEAAGADETIWTDETAGTDETIWTDEEHQADEAIWTDEALQADEAAGADEALQADEAFGTE